jgi:hypothetical protein
MLLPTLFDSPYSQCGRMLVADNRTIEYAYTKGPIGDRMSIRVISLNWPRLRFTIRFRQGQERLTTLTCPIDHPLLDLRECLLRTVYIQSENKI